jgi:hypothetical protein
MKEWSVNFCLVIQFERPHLVKKKSLTSCKSRKEAVVFYETWERLTMGKNADNDF